MLEHSTRKSFQKPLVYPSKRQRWPWEATGSKTLPVFASVFGVTRTFTVRAGKGKGKEKGLFQEVSAFYETLYKGSWKLEQNIFLSQVHTLQIIHFPPEENSELSDLGKCSWSYSSDFFILYPWQSNLPDCQETFFVQLNWERGQRRGEERDISGKRKTTQGRNNNAGQDKV